MVWIFVTEMSKQTMKTNAPRIAQKIKFLRFKFDNGKITAPLVIMGPDILLSSQCQAPNMIFLISPA